MTYAGILGTGSYLPPTVLTNDDMAARVDTTDEWITKRVGIKERHVLGEGETVLSLAHPAAQRALEAAGLDANAIDLIIVATTTPEMHFPSTACFLSRALGGTNDAPAFDLNAACGGFVYALTVADQFIRNGQAKHALVVGVDVLSRLIDWNDRSTCVLFGDGAGAVVLGAQDHPGIKATRLHADGQYIDNLLAPNQLWHPEKPIEKIKMSGAETFKVAVTKLGQVVDQIMLQAGVTADEVDWLIPHQANLRIIQAMAKKLRLPMEKVVVTIQHHGNTSAGSIPLALDTAVRSGQIKRGDQLLLEAFGAGFAWGAALLIY